MKRKSEGEMEKVGQIRKDLWVLVDLRNGGTGKGLTAEVALAAVHRMEELLLESGSEAESVVRLGEKVGQEPDEIGFVEEASEEWDSPPYDPIVEQFFN